MLVKISRAVSVVIAIAGLSFLLTVPLGWNEQAIFAAALLAIALLLNWLSRSATVTLGLMGISLFATLRYAFWRVMQTWEGITSSGHSHDWHTVFVLPLLFAEFYAFVTLILSYFQILRPLQRPPVPLSDPPNRWPVVDVLIPTYNEPLTVVRATVLSALAMDYPAEKMRVAILDDGCRSEFRGFAAEIGVDYITRDKHVHAKAGNINHALQRTTGEFVAIFDCDHVPTRSFLQTTLGWFARDERLGLVQTPHLFYSPDPFERNLGQFRKVPNECELFHRLVQDGNDLWNATFFCGSCAVLRRTTLLEIGGIAVETVTEDAHTALRMQRRGWNTALINIPQAAGLATESLAAHIGQRIRWARGMVQILRLENPLFGRGLSLPQRLCYFNAATHFLFATPRLIFLTIPLVYLMFGIVNIYGYSLAVCAYALPHIMLATIANSRVQRQYRFSFWSEIYETVLAPYILLPTLLALINPRLGRFNVTSKGGVIKRSFFDHRIALPFLVLLALNGMGLVMAWHRYVTDPAHHDTIIVNAVWTAYNVLILSVAASVAWEKKQRRSEVRIDVRVPLSVIAADGRRFAAATTQLSRQGAAVYVERSARLRVGTAVRAAFDHKGSRCDIAARVVARRGRRYHLAFQRVGLVEERFLLGVTYSPPRAWIGWHRSHRPDRPLISLLQIVMLSVRGVVLVTIGLIALPVVLRSRDRESRRYRTRAPFAGSLTFLLSVLIPVNAGAFQQDRAVVGPADAPAFEEFYSFGDMGGAPAGIALQSAGATGNLFFGMPVTKIISRATLQLRYAAPYLRPGESHLEFWLNGTRVADVSLLPGTSLQAEVPIPSDLLTSDNALSLRLSGSCSGCPQNGGPWVTVAPDSTLRVGGSRLTLANDLSLLPVPFVDLAGQSMVTLPSVFSDRPDLTELEAASMVASWFGVFSDIRGVKFPVTIGQLPDGNAVVFVLDGSPLAALLSVPSHPGGMISLRDNPRDPYGKLLILAGNESADLLAAARTLVTQNSFPARPDFPAAARADVRVRREYDAPRWLATDKVASVGMYTSAARLELRGSGSLNLYFRLPPDLFLPARQSVPLLLKYDYAGAAEHAALHVRVNDQDVDSIRLVPAGGTTTKAEVVRLPTGRLRAYANTLTIDVDFGGQGQAATVVQHAAIHRDSSIDLRDLPHSVVLPRLELFADAGYPFTAWPDLGSTAIVLPAAPTLGEYQSLLNITGFFGAQTGAPATALTVTDLAHINAVRDKDLIVLGSSASQPLLSVWRNRLPLQFSGDGMLPSPEPTPSRWIHGEWPFREADRRRLSLAIADAPVDLVVEHFVSPFRPDRSIVAIAPRTAAGYDVIPVMFLPAVRRGPIYGGVALAGRGEFQSFLVGTLAYHAGTSDPYQQSVVFIFEHYWLIPGVVAVLALIIAMEVHQRVERTAGRRLAVGKV